MTDPESCVRCARCSRLRPVLPLFDEFLCDECYVPRGAEHQAAAEPTPPAEDGWTERVLSTKAVTCDDIEQVTAELRSSLEDAPHSAPEAPPDPPPLAPPDAAAAFVGEACKPNRKAFTSTAEIMAAARGWCDEHNAMSFGPRTLAAQLRRLGGQPHSNGQRRGWRGIKLR